MSWRWIIKMVQKKSTYSQNILQITGSPSQKSNTILSTQESSSSDGSIAGGVIGGIIILAALVIVGVFMYRYVNMN